MDHLTHIHKSENATCILNASNGIPNNFTTPQLTKFDPLSIRYTETETLSNKSHERGFRHWLVLLESKSDKNLAENKAKMQEESIEELSFTLSIIHRYLE